MAKIILFLLLLTIRSNAYAWSCYFSSTAEGWYLNNSMHCEGISTQDALQYHYCGWYRPSDPYCSVYQVPVCSNTVEYQTLSCPIHQSGAINQSRNYDCNTQAWSAWTTTSNNCTPDPPTCIESSETRQVACASGFEGFVTEQRNSICSDPYGSPTWTAWSTISNTCKMTVDNVNNVASPVSPISPLNPNSVVNQITTAPIIQTEPVTVQDMTVSTTTATTQSSTSTESTTQSTLSNTTTTSVIEKVPEAPKGKEIVPGFGIVMSMQILNQGYNMQQQQIQEAISLEQENEYGRTQDFTLSLLSETTVGDRFDSLNRSRWTNLLRNYPLQRLEWGD